MVSNYNGGHSNANTVNIHHNHQHCHTLAVLPLDSSTPAMRQQSILALVDIWAHYPPLLAMPGSGRGRLLLHANNEHGPPSHWASAP